MATITELPRTCSLYYLSGLNEWEDFREVVRQCFIRQQAEKSRDHQRVCAIMATTQKPAIIANLRKAGFKTMYEYLSHGHKRNVSVMIRELSVKEWRTLKPDFPKEKKVKGTKRIR